MLGLAKKTIFVFLFTQFIIDSTDAEKFSPSYKKSIVLDSKKIYNSSNVSSITVEDVLGAAKQFLNFWY